MSKSESESEVISSGEEIDMTSKRATRQKTLPLRLKDTELNLEEISCDPLSK